MKKTSEPFAGVKHDHSEVSRRLYKGALDTARRLEERIRAVSSLQELLGPEVTALRTRLKDYCERLMFSDPVEYGRKAEELMWRKVYYEIIQLSKQHQKKLVTEGNEELSRHLLAGMGSYQHLLLRLQTEFYLDLEGNVDVPFIWQQKGTKKEKWKKRQKDREVEEPVQEWCRQACHHFLICLGDLARYTSDLGYEENVHLAKRYYYQAFAVEPSMGMPHNQLGTLTAMTAGGCNAAYHYLRCLQSPKPFEGAEGNLQRVFEKNIQTFKELDNTEERDGELVTRRFLARFLKLCEDFLICQEENIESLCQDILQDFHHCVTSIQYSQDEDEGVEQLDSSLIFKLTMMTVMCAHRLQTTGSPLISTATAFLLTYFSHQCCYCVQRLQSALFPFSISAHPFNNYEDTDTRSTSATATPVPPTEDNCAIVESTTEYNDKRFVKRKIKERSLSRRRVSRRRKQSSTSQEDSELSEGHSESDLEEKNSSDTASCTSGSITEHGVEEEELSDCGEHSGLGVENVTSTAVDCNGELEENLTSNKAVLQNGLDCISKSTTSVSQEDKDNTENEHLSNGDVQNKSEGSYSVSGIVTPQSLVEQELTPSVVEVIKIVNQEGLLPGIKVVADWLIINSDIIVTYGESCQILWSHVINLLNLLKKVHDKLKNDASPPSVQGFVWNGPEWKQTQPLPEDFTLRGLAPLENFHLQLDFDTSYGLCSKEEVFLRIQCLHSFGQLLARLPKTGVNFNSEKECFTASSTEKCFSGAESTEAGLEQPVGQRKQMMRNMAHLWLKAEVNDLESKVKGGGFPQLSPYLVPDISSFCQHLALLKQLRLSKRFVIVVPSVVIASLDERKKESVGAREAIRWLENELRHGTRYIRAQRPQECLSLSPIKYPRRKEKEAWEFFQVLECAHFFNNQGSSNDPTDPLVTLLTAGASFMPPSAAALAKSTGIQMENITDFTNKWRTSSKSQG